MSERRVRPIRQQPGGSHSPDLRRALFLLFLALVTLLAILPSGITPSLAQEGTVEEGSVAPELVGFGEDCGTWKWYVYYDCAPGPGVWCPLGLWMTTEEDINYYDGNVIVGAFQTEGQALNAICGGKVWHVGGPTAVYGGPKAEVFGATFGIAGFGHFDTDGNWVCREPLPDDDGDGVPNHDDACPETGGVVSTMGCPCEEPVEEPTPEPTATTAIVDTPTIPAQVWLDPVEGPPGSKVGVYGQDFPPGKEIEIRWDSEEGELLGTSQTDSSGNLWTAVNVPERAEEGEHRIYIGHHNSPDITWYWAQFDVVIWCIEGTVRVRLKGGLPVRGAEVVLLTRNAAGALIQVLDQKTGGRPYVVTDEFGRYEICSPLITVPMAGALLRVQLGERALLRSVGVVHPPPGLAAIPTAINPGGPPYWPAWQQQPPPRTFEVIDSPMGFVVEAFFGLNGAIGADPNNGATWFPVNEPVDLRRDLWFEDVADVPTTNWSREEVALEAALVYYHTEQAARFWRNVGAPLAGLPVRVFIYSPNPTSCSGNEIDINEEDSGWNDGNAPKNREWHEFSHYVMWSTYGQFPPLHREDTGLVGDVNGNRVTDIDGNHGGYWNNEMSSSDAIVEGFAWFGALVIADEMDRQGDAYMNDHLPPFIYPISSGGPSPLMVNLEVNKPLNRLPTLPSERRQQVRDLFLDMRVETEPGTLVTIKPHIDEAEGDEEECIGSVLWDLYDGVNGADHDQISLPMDQLWPILSTVYTFPQYYQGVPDGDTLWVTQFLGDPFAYGGKWFYGDTPAMEGGFNGVRDLDAPWPTTNRNIWYVMDLYNALSQQVPGQQAAINQVFFRHQITLNTFQILEDYAGLDEAEVSTFADEEAAIEVSIGHEAGHDFWRQGVVADLDVSGWGAGFTVPQKPAFDARGFLYLQVWLNAPEGATFEIVVEDDDGQWLASGTSAAILDLTEDPLDMTRFQRGIGGWGAYSPGGYYGPVGTVPYLVVLNPSPAAEEQKYLYEWRPNPYYHTPPSEKSGPDPSEIRAVGVLFTEPGQYQAMVGPVALTLDYPWKPGMGTIYGLGDPTQGRFRPYRRDRRPIPGSQALVTVDKVPVTLQVTISYAEPYQDLSFTYPLEITQTAQEIWLYVEPPLEGGENTITIAAEGQGLVAREPFALTSTEYWNALDPDAYVAEISLEMVPAEDGPTPVPGQPTLEPGQEPDDLPFNPWWIAAICGGLLVIALGAGLGLALGRRARERRERRERRPW